MSPEAVHKLAAALILAFVIPMFAKELGKLAGRWPSYLLPVGLIGFALFLILDPIVFHGGSFGAEGLQHQIQGAVMLGVGVVELVRARGKLQRLGFALLLPAAIIGIGLLFVFHSQHGGGDMAAQLAQHRILGATVVWVGVIKATDAFYAGRERWAAVGWLILLVAVALQLFLYVEGSGSHGAMPMPSGHGGH